MQQRFLTFSTGDDGRNELIPLLGEIQGYFLTFGSLADRPLGVRAPRNRLEWYAACLGVAAACLLTALLAGASSLEGPLWIVLSLAVVALLAERQSVHITANTQMSVSAMPILFAAVVYGPLAAMLVAAVAHLGDVARPITRWAIWTSSRVLTAGLAGILAAALIAQNSSLGGVLLAVAVASVAEAVLDITFNSLTVGLRQSGSVVGTARAMSRLVLSTVPLYTPVIGVLAYSFRELSPWTVLLFFVPALAAQRLLTMYQEQTRLVADLGAANQSLERAGLSFATALVAALDARDEYTAGHSAAVAIYARDIAYRLGLSEDQQNLAHLCGLVHDIGKVGLPPGLLEKPGPLTLEERRRMEEHPAIGERILAKVEDYAEIATIVRHHHERVDGNGYPDGLRNADIPLLSRIIAVADAYNAMTSDRPYRDAMPSRVARLRLAQAVETQFDTAVVAAFEAILASAGESYVCGASPDFALDVQRYAGPLVEAAAASAA
jgi:putative nucleotidyltransferase with HDIG domain